MENFSDFLENNRNAKEARIITHRPLPSLSFEEKLRMYLHKKETKYVAIAVVAAFVIAFYVGQRSNSSPQSFPAQSRSTISSSANTSTTNPNLTIKVYVSGAVNKPGVYELDSKARIGDAILLAGGSSSTASLSSCNLAGFLTDGMAVIVPTGNEDTPSCGEIASTVSSPGGTTSQTSSAVSKVSLNKGTQSELESLPGVGPSLAGAIIDFRTRSGGFKSVNDLRKVKGIGDKRFLDLKDLVVL